MTERTYSSAPVSGQSETPRRSVLDRSLYALFARHADSSRHAADRDAYRGTDINVSFGVYLARLYAVSWLVAATVLLVALPVTVAIISTRPAIVPLTDMTSTTLVGVATACLLAACCKWATVRLGGRYLVWRARARRSNIEQTLPGAVRYLRVLSTGSDDLRGMLSKVANNREAYGQTAVAFRKALNKATLTGSLSAGLRLVARDTPSRDALAPFLLKFREHAQQGEKELTSYLRMESRMLSHKQSRARQRRQDFLELLAELFIVLLVLPALLAIVVAVLSVLSTGLSQEIATPAGSITGHAVVVYGSAVFVLAVGAVTALIVDSLRPPGQRRSYQRPSGLLATLASSTTNPASAAPLFGLTAFVAAIGFWSADLRFVDVLLLSYVAFAVPVGVVAIRRARIDDAKDREIKDFIHAISGHVSLGRPFPEAVELVARDVDLGALNEDVNDLAFNAGVTTRDGDLRSDALDRFVDRVGTPLAEQTIGLVTGALDAGGDTEDVFETLQTEVGRLHLEKQQLRSAMSVYVAVGWTTGLLVVGIMIAVNVYVLDGFTQLSAISDADTGIALDPTAVDPAALQERFYVVAQATMLACGWFAGMASRGPYEALLHSGALVGIAYLVFAGVGVA